jgi:hypothetical protein
MKLFWMQIGFKNRRRRRVGVELVVHAPSKKGAEKHAMGKYTGCTIERVRELENVPRHFVLADLED